MPVWPTIRVVTPSVKQAASSQGRSALCSFSGICNLEYIIVGGGLIYSAWHVQGLALGLSEIQMPDVASMGERNLEHAGIFTGVPSRKQRPKRITKLHAEAPPSIVECSWTVASLLRSKSATFTPSR